MRTPLPGQLALHCGWLTCCGCLTDPDKNPDRQEEAQAKFIEIGNAFETLSDPAARRSYDRMGPEGAQAAAGRGGGGPQFNFRRGAHPHFAQFQKMFEEQMRAAVRRQLASLPAPPLPDTLTLRRGTAASRSPGAGAPTPSTRRRAARASSRAAA